MRVSISQAEAGGVERSQGRRFGLLLAFAFCVLAAASCLTAQLAEARMPAPKIKTLSTAPT
jgi:hypothetical protein